MDDAVRVSEADDDLGDAEQERLGPELEELSLVLEHVAIGA
jgi:hypothetical protein